MTTPPLSSRREFLTQMAVGASALQLLSVRAASAAPAANKTYKIIGFAKPFQHLKWHETADLAAEVGWNGIECPVRKGGQVLPERVEEDLPKFVEALRKRNLDLPIIATDIFNASGVYTEKVLRTASKLGIKIYRIAHLNYNEVEPIPSQLNRIRSGLRELLALNRELGLCAVYENHSGRNSVGGPVWDVFEMVRDLDPQFYGICFDIGHATIDGGSAWRTNLRLVQPFLKSIYVKDFNWKKTGSEWKAEWCPLGDGMIDKRFAEMLHKSAFNGPVVQFHEYPVGNGDQMVAAFKKDLATLKRWLAEV